MFTSAKYHPTANWTQVVFIKNNTLRVCLLFLPLLIFFFRVETSFRVQSPLVWNLEGTGPSTLEALGGGGEDV